MAPNYASTTNHSASTTYITPLPEPTSVNTPEYTLSISTKINTSKSIETTIPVAPVTSNNAQLESHKSVSTISEHTTSFTISTETTETHATKFTTTNQPNKHFSITNTIFTVSTEHCDSSPCRQVTTVYTTVYAATIYTYTTLYSTDSKGEPLPPYATTIVVTVPVLPSIGTSLVPSQHDSVFKASTFAEAFKTAYSTPEAIVTAQTETSTANSKKTIPTGQTDTNASKPAISAVSTRATTTVGVDVSFEGSAGTLTGSMIMIMISMLLLF